MADRRYDDKEVGEILKAAAEMQSGLAPTGTAKGMTLGELQSVAQEIGLNSENIGRAAQELDSTLMAKSRSKSDSIHVEQTIDGPLSDETWEELVAALRRFAGRAGKSAENGQTREWTCGWDGGSLIFTATTRGGRTRLRLLGGTSPAAAVVGGIVVGIFAFISPMVVRKSMHLAIAPLITAGLMCLMVALCVMGTKVVARAQRKAFEGRIEDLLGELVALGEAAPVLEPSMRRIVPDIQSVQQNSA